MLVDHGSHVAQSNDVLFRVAVGLKRLTSWTIVEPAHMELSEPSIAMALAQCVAQGADLVVVFPYLLSPGRHVSVDIPRLVEAAAAHYPDLETRIAQPFGLHDLLLKVVIERVTQCLDQE